MTFRHPNLGADDLTLQLALSQVFVGRNPVPLALIIAKTCSRTVLPGKSDEICPSSTTLGGHLAPILQVSSRKAHHSPLDQLQMFHNRMVVA